MPTVIHRKKLLGSVSPEERDEIRSLFERRNGLLELFKALPDLGTEQADSLYEKIVKDIGKVATQYQEWWAEVSSKHGWKKTPGGSWEIDFLTREVFLRTGDVASKLRRQ